MACRRSRVRVPLAPLQTAQPPCCPRRRLPHLVFRGSITRPQHSLSTLRSALWRRGTCLLDQPYWVPYALTPASRTITGAGALSLRSKGGGRIDYGVRPTILPSPTAKEGHSPKYDMARNRLLRLPYVLLALGAGCIELQLALQGVVPGSIDGRPPTTDRDAEPDDRPEGNIPVVRLDVSNPSPQVNEEVVLTCSVVGGDAAGVRFDFQPADDRLFVNRTRGTASFIVEETDISVSFAFTCTATNETGTSGLSNQQVIIATP